MSYRSALRILGRLVLLLAVAQLAPLAVAAIYGEPQSINAFSISAIVTGVVGALLAFAIRPQRDAELFRREGILIVVGGWVLASLFGALPFLIAGTVHSVADAVFESASGFSTTGATILIDIEAADRAILFWRSFTQWLGGMGIVVLFVALLPQLGPGARFLYRLEVPGPKAETVGPRISETAAVLWKVYLGFTALETVLLMLAGMNLYDALTHTFSTLSTGGFSPRAESVAAFDSVAVELIIILFMIVAGTNFSLFLAVPRERLKVFFRDTEFRVYLGILAGGVIAVTTDLLFHGTYSSPLRAILDSVFQLVSITTTTGFGTADFEAWPTFSTLLLVVLMFVGGCAGSTSGSMKIMRMVIGVKTAFREVKQIFSPSTIFSVFVGGKAVPDSVAKAVVGFFILYLSSWGIGSVLLSIGSPDIVTAATAAAATLGNIGPGLGQVGPTDNFAFFSDAHKLLMVVLMWMGRLELYSFAALVTPMFWRR